MRITSGEAAKFSKLAYKLDLENLSEGWEVLLDSRQFFAEQTLPTIAFPAVPLDTDLESEPSGYRGVAFINRTQKIIVIAHRGTENVANVMDDIGLCRDVVPSSYKYAQIFNEHIGQQVSNCVFISVGHSLGGTLATLDAFEFNRMAIAIDPPGTRSMHIKRYGKDRISEGESNIVNYFSTENLVNTFGESTGQNKWVELEPVKRKLFDKNSQMIKDLTPLAFFGDEDARDTINFLAAQNLGSHGINNFVKAIDKKTGKLRLLSTAPASGEEEVTLEPALDNKSLFTNTGIFVSGNQNESDQESPTDAPESPREKQEPPSLTPSKSPREEPVVTHVSEFNPNISRQETTKEPLQLPYQTAEDLSYEQNSTLIGIERDLLDPVKEFNPSSNVAMGIVVGAGGIVGLGATLTSGTATVTAVGTASGVGGSVSVPISASLAATAPPVAFAALAAYEGYEVYKWIKGNNKYRYKELQAMDPGQKKKELKKIEIVASQNGVKLTNADLDEINNLLEERNEKQQDINNGKTRVKKLDFYGPVVKFVKQKAGHSKNYSRREIEEHKKVFNSINGKIDAICNQHINTFNSTIKALEKYRTRKANQEKNENKRAITLIKRDEAKLKKNIQSLFGCIDNLQDGLKKKSLTLIGVSYVELGDIDAENLAHAKNAFTRVLESDPNNVGAHSFLSKFAYEEKEFNKMVEHADRMFGFKETKEQADYLYTAVARHLAGNREQALECLDALHELDTNNSVATKTALECCIEAKDNDGIIKYGTRCLDHDWQAEQVKQRLYNAYVAKAKNLIVKQDEKNSAMNAKLEFLFKAKALDLGRQEAVFIDCERAKIYQLAGQFDNTDVCYREALTNASDKHTSVKIHRELVKNKLHQKDFIAATDYQEEICHADYSSVEDYKALGALYMQQQAYQKATTTYKEYLRRKPGDLETHLKCASAEMHTGNYLGAKEDFDVVLKLEPDNFMATMGLANIYFKKGDTTKALPLYKKAIALQKRAGGFIDEKIIANSQELFQIVQIRLARESEARRTQMLEDNLDDELQAFTTLDGSTTLPCLTSHIGTFFSIRNSYHFTNLESDRAIQRSRRKRQQTWIQHQATLRSTERVTLPSENLNAQQRRDFQTLQMNSAYQQERLPRMNFY